MRNMRDGELDKKNIDPEQPSDIELPKQRRRITLI